MADNKISEDQSKMSDVKTMLKTEDKLFSCSLCSFKSAYSYHGHKPPFLKSLMLLERAYIVKDPFTKESSMITIGGTCSLCGKDVCVSQSCSLFYTKRFCAVCASNNISEFPKEIQQEFTKQT